MTILSRGKENFCLEIGRRRNRQILWRRNIFGMVSRRGKKNEDNVQAKKKMGIFWNFFFRKICEIEFGNLTKCT